jgi:hypothetical protein
MTHVGSDGRMAMIHSEPVEHFDIVEQAFCEQVVRAGGTSLLDLGGDPTRFGLSLRSAGYTGRITSFTPSQAEYASIRPRADADPLWAIWREVIDFGTERIGLPKCPPLLSREASASIQAARMLVDPSEDLGEGRLEAWLTDLRKVNHLLVQVGACETDADRAGLEAALSETVSRLGFRRAPPNDDSAGVGVQRSLHFVHERVSRAAALGRSEEEPESSDPVRLVTSIGGSPLRLDENGDDVGALWQAACLASFRRLAREVHSVSEVAPPSSDIIWVRCDSRPTIHSLLRPMVDRPESMWVLVNGDILISEHLSELLPRLDRSTLYIASRRETKLLSGHDVDTMVLGDGEVYSNGFDLFIIAPELARAIMESGHLDETFKVGLPWWDYMLPLVARLLGYPVKRLPDEPILIRHLSHPARYSEEVHLAIGRTCQAKLTNSNHPGSHRLGDLAHIVQQDSRLGGLARFAEGVLELLMSGFELSLSIFQTTESAFYNAANRVSVYGSGVIGDKVVRCALSLGFMLDSVIDSDPDRHGGDLNGFRIISLDEAVARGTDVFIVASVAYQKEIVTIIENRFAGRSAPRILTLATSTGS